MSRLQRTSVPSPWTPPDSLLSSVRQVARGTVFVHGSPAPSKGGKVAPSGAPPSSSAPPSVGSVLASTSPPSAGAPPVAAIPPVETTPPAPLIPPAPPAAPPTLSELLQPKSGTVGASAPRANSEHLK